MSLFNFGKDKPKEEGNPTVMAYLEDALRTKCPAMIIDSRKNEIPCSIVAIQEPNGTMQLQLRANLLAERGSKITFVVIIDSMRIGGSSKLQEVKPGNAVIDIPDSFDLMERRKKQRAKINPREGTTCILLSGLFDGIGITGLPENMSENGMRLKVEKSLEIPSERPINLTSRHTPVGQIFPILKLSKIPRVVATIEAAGRLIYSEASMGTTYLGITFEEMKSEYAKVIGAFVAGRSSPLPNSLPSRSRRSASVDSGGGLGPGPGSGSAAADGSKPDSAAPEKPGSEKPGSAAPAPSDKGAPAPSSAAPAENENKPSAEGSVASTPETSAPGTSAPMAADGSADKAPVALQRPAPTPLQKLKRKGKTIVLFGVEEEQALAKLLQDDGYGKVVCPDSMEGLLESIPLGGAGLLLLDLDMPFDNCLAIAGSILDHSPDPIPMILISEDKQVGVGRSNDAQAIGISALLPRPLKIDDALFSKIDELMSGNG
jgi:hypothetical protein